jgi:hypothetical protein
MKRSAWLLLALAISSLAGACTGADIGSEYIDVSEDESELLFYGPGLAGGYRQFLTGQDEQYVRRTMATYGPQRGEFPFARIYLSETPPMRHFTRVPPVEKTIEQWGWFGNKTVKIGAVDATVNTIGRIDFVTATADGVACVLWLQTFGPREGSGVGTRVLDGYYCRGRGPMMPVSEAESIVRLVGHKEYGAVEPPAGWSAAIAVPAHRTEPASLRIQVMWSNASSGVDSFDGEILFSEGQETAVIKIGANTGRDCEGVVSYDREEMDKVNMLWRLTCADGVAASGKLTLRTADNAIHLVGQGEDSSGQIIAITD